MYANNFLSLICMLTLQINEVERTIPVRLFIFKIWEGTFSDLQQASLELFTLPSS